MEKQKNELYNHTSYKKINIIISVIVSLFSIQYLAFISFFKVNFPYSSDVPDIVFFTYDFLKLGQINLLDPVSGHFFVFPRLISFVNLYFNSFDVNNLFYLQWVVISITIFMMYLILKQTDKKLLWTLIPISAFLYCPLASSNYFIPAMLAWQLPTLSITAIIYFLNKKTNPKNISFSISLAIFSTLSTVIGIIGWIPGLIINQKKKWFIFWIFSMIIFGIFYISIIPNGENELHPELLISYEGYAFIATFLSTPFRLKYDFLMVIVGSLSLFLSAYCLYYFVKIEKNLRNVLPWFTFIFIAVVGAIVTAVGRIHLEDHIGNEPYYITISQLFQIGLLILISKILINTRKKPKRRILTSVLISIIIIQMLLLLPSYYSGWERGEYYMNEKINYINCYSLSPHPSCIDKISGKVSDQYYQKYYEMINFWIEEKLSIFSEKNFNDKNKFAMNEYFLISNENFLSNNGAIMQVNHSEFTQNFEYELNLPYLLVEGWMLDPQLQQLDSLYLIMNDEPLSKTTIFESNTFQISDIQTNSEVNSTWRIFIMSGYIDYGCHDVSIIGIKDMKKFGLTDKFTLCKNPE
ncbi:MAG: hypothetical protein HOL90_06765 [Candidatus Nitrosopelagicus sp.]|nr:hypothetical protein [Candidatus Nitrosopelagicus sp.]